MNLQPIFPPRPGCLPKACSSCGGDVPLNGGFADLDGVRLKSYLCIRCAKLSFTRTSGVAEMLQEAQMIDFNQRLPSGPKGKT